MHHGGESAGSPSRTQAREAHARMYVNHALVLGCRSPKTRPRRQTLESDHPPPKRIYLLETLKAGAVRLPSTYLALGELQRTLVPANLEELHETLLVGGAADDITDEIANVLHASTDLLREYDWEGGFCERVIPAKKPFTKDAGKQGGHAPPCAERDAEPADAWRRRAPS